MRSLWVRVFVVAAIGVFGGLSAVAWAVKPEPYNPVIDPANFVGVIDNPYMPLTPGTAFVYEAETPDGLEQDVVVVTHDTKDILGVTCTVVTDTATADGELVEDTLDWYAQDKDGNVWYFGEDTTQYEGGQVVGQEGSWEAGVDGALPGIVMQGNPRPGMSYRQEYLQDVAEDMAKVLRLNARVSVPYGDFDECLLSKEWSRLEPGHIEHKYYAPGVGLVLTVELKGKNVRSELVSITPP